MRTTITRILPVLVSMLLLVSCSKKYVIGHSMKSVEARLLEPVRLSENSSVEFNLLELDRIGKKCLFRVVDSSAGLSAECWIPVGGTFSSCPIPRIQGVTVSAMTEDAAVLRTRVTHLSK